MSNFAYPEWQLPPGYYDPPPPLDPETRRDLDTQVEEALNGFIEARQKVLHLEPDAYYRKRGREAVEGVGAITDRLNGLKAEILARAGTDYERRALEERTSALIGLDQEDVRRHVRRELKEWQRQAMTRRIELMRKQAGFNWKDRAALQTYADAAESAARDHGWADGLAPDSEEVLGRVQAARSGVLRSAVEGALNGNHLADAIALYQQISPHLASGDVQAIGPQIDYARELETGHGYVAPFIKTLPDRLDEIDAAHRAALERNAVDWPDSPSQHATNRYLMDRAFGEHRHNITQRRADLEKQIEAWVDQRQPGDSPWPPRRLWAQLDPDQRQQVYERLKFSAGAPDSAQPQQAREDTATSVPARGVAPNVEPLPGSPEFEIARASIPEQVDDGQTLMSASAPAVAAPATGGTGLVPALLQVARAVAPYAAAAATPVAAAIPLLLIPNNTQSGTVDLDDGLRARIRPGQRTVTIERRTDKSLLGIGIGSTWEDLPVEAEIGWSSQGRSILINREQLVQTLGEEQAQRVLAAVGATPPSEPQVIPPPVAYEMRIGESVKGGKLVHREATEEEVTEVCGSYPRYYRMAFLAAMQARAAGLSNGLAYGNFVHDQVTAEIRAMKSQLEAEGIHEIQPKIALHSGFKKSYLPKGSSEIDILELREGGVVCVYEIKTGGARFAARRGDNRSAQA